jgi:cytochrome P450
MWLLLLSITVCILCLIYLVTLIGPRPVYGIPLAQQYSPIFGHLLPFLQNFTHLHDARLHEALRHESLGHSCFQELLPLIPPRVDLLTPELVEFVLRSEFNSFEKGSLFTEPFREVFGQGLLNSDGSQWKLNRRMAQHLVTRNGMNTAQQVFIEHANRFLKLLRDVKTADMQVLFHRYTMDCTCELVCGFDLNSLSSQSAVPFVNAFDSSVAICVRRFLVPEFLWKLKRWLNVGNEKLLKQHCQTINQFVTDIVEQHNIVGDDLLSRLLEEEQMTKQLLRDTLVNMIAAGRDTVAVALTHLFHVLHNYPEIEQKLIEELYEKANNVISEETLSNLVYMDCVILEVCRLHPPLPLDFKVCARDIRLPGTTDITLPKSTIVSYTPYHFHRLSSVWGVDAMNFKPERWLDLDGKIKVESQFKFLSFNAGPRLCLGRAMALLEVKTLAATLLNQFHFKLDDEENFNTNIRFTTTCPFSNGLNMTVMRRQHRSID